MNFTVTRESCGSGGIGNCSLTADYSLKYPGKHKIMFQGPAYTRLIIFFADCCARICVRQLT